VRKKILIAKKAWDASSLFKLSCCPHHPLMIESQTELALADLQHGMLPYPGSLLHPH
jgi:hypothetical protein